MRDTIIAVDNDEDIREMLVDLFKAANIRFFCFSNAKDAKVYLINPNNSSRVHSIISDLMMAPTDGIDFLSYVKSKPELSEIDLYLLTGAVASVFEPLLRSYQLKGVIEKPFDSKKLIEMFQKKISESQKFAA